MAWNHENEERLKSMWAGGATASEIAKELGMTRNTVMGKAHRLGCEARINPVNTKAGKFERIIDLIVDQDMTLLEASLAVAMPHSTAIEMWRDLCARIGWQAA